MRSLRRASAHAEGESSHESGLEVRKMAVPFRLQVHVTGACRAMRLLKL